MKLTITVEDGDVATEVGVPATALASAWEIVNDAWIKAQEAGPNQASVLQWVGGAVRVYAAAAGRSPEDVRDELSRNRPLVSGTAIPPPGTDDAVVIPPDQRKNRPPRSPGAQHVVDLDAEPIEEDWTDEPVDIDAMRSRAIRIDPEG